MFNIGEKIVYGQTGVCVVEDISEKELIKNVKKQYYTLRPVFRSNNTIYAPVDNKNVFMRKIISANEANQFIKSIPEIRRDALADTENTDYKAELETHNCRELAFIAFKVRNKKQEARRQNRKLGFSDEKYLKIAEDLLFGELAVALGAEPDEIQSIIYSA